MRRAECGVRSKNPVRPLLVAFFLVLTSCGYGLSGRGLLVPEGAKTIAIPSFLNVTNEPYVDVEITRAVVDEFVADGRLRVVDVDTADLALRGRITRYDVTALSYTPDSYVQQYSVRLVVDASLEDRRAGTVIWQERGVEAVFISDYPVTIGDIQATKAAKETAIKKASRDIAWTLRSRVLEGF